MLCALKETPPKCSSCSLLCEMPSAVFKCFFILYFVGLSYHGPIDIEEFIVIHLNYTHNPPAHSAVIEFKFGDEIKRPCQIMLESSYHSMSVECLFAQKSNFTAEVNITYKTSVELDKRFFRTVIRDSHNNKLYEGEWQPFPPVIESGHNDTDLKQYTNITCEVTKETLWQYQLGFGITTAVESILILVLSVCLFKTSRQVKLLKAKLINFGCKDTETGPQDVSQDINKKSQKKLNLTYARKPENKDDHGENNREVAMEMTRPQRDVGTSSDGTVRSIRLTEI